MKHFVQYFLVCTYDVYINFVNRQSYLLQFRSINFLEIEKNENFLAQIQFFS